MKGSGWESRWNSWQHRWCQRGKGLSVVAKKGWGVWPLRNLSQIRIRIPGWAAMHEVYHGHMVTPMRTMTNLQPPAGPTSNHFCYKLVEEKGRTCSGCRPI